MAGIDVYVPETFNRFPNLHNIIGITMEKLKSMLFQNIDSKSKNEYLISLSQPNNIASASSPANKELKLLHFELITEVHIFS